MTTNAKQKIKKGKKSPLNFGKDTNRVVLGGVIQDLEIMNRKNAAKKKRKAK